jgi:ribosome biogenesis protein NSA1
MAIAPGILATTALDRFARIHSVYPLPKLVGQQQDQRGRVLEKVFTRSVPISVVWDGHSPTSLRHSNGCGDDDDDDVWRNMQHIEDESEAEEDAPSKHRRRRRS